jgi:hypothetical protein
VLQQRFRNFFTLSDAFEYVLLLAALKVCASLHCQLNEHFNLVDEIRHWNTPIQVAA